MANAIDILITATDKASSVLSGLSKETKNFSSSVENSFKSVINTSAIVSGAVTATSALILKTASDTANGLDIERGFARSFGDDVTGNLDTLRNASKGTISDIDLMQTANRAALLGISTNVEDLSALILTARLRGKEMGLTTTQAFNDIVTGIGRGSPLILDNLGIKIPDAIKKQMESMGEAEKMQLLLNFAMEDGAQIAEQLGGDIETPSDKIAQLSAIVKNAYNSLGKFLLPIVLKVIDAGNKLAKSEFATRFVDKLKSMANNISNLVAKLSPLVERYLPTLQSIGEKVARTLVDNLDIVLLAIALTMSTFVIPNIIATVSAMAPFILTVGAIALAVYGLREAWVNNWGGIREKVEMVVSWFTETAIPLIQEYLLKLQEFWAPIWSDIQEILILAWDVMSKGIERALLIYETVVKPVLNGVWEFIKNNMNKISSFINGIWQVITGVISVAWAVISGIIKTGLNILKGDWSGAWESIKEMFSKIWEGMGGIVSGLWNTITNGFKLGFNALIGLINSGIKKVNQSIDDIRGVDVIGSLVPDVNIPEIPKLARGTDYFGGGVAIVGEQGPEIVNMPRGAKVTPNNAIGGIGGSTINNTFNNVDIDASELSRLLMFQLKTL